MTLTNSIRLYKEYLARGMTKECEDILKIYPDIREIVKREEKDLLKEMEEKTLIVKPKNKPKSKKKN